MLDKKLVSIIVPVYKVEMYLSECLESLVNQTYTNLEIILIDDGSPDNCGKICDIYAEKDKRVKVIHKENGGLSSARNTGIDIMQGEYVTFVDSDDYIKPTYIETLIHLCTNNGTLIGVINATVIIENNGKIYEINKYNNKQKEEVISTHDALLCLFHQKKYDFSVWGKIYAATLFDGVRFPLMKLCEDWIPTYLLIKKSNGVSCSNEKLYFYRQHENNISNDVTRYNKFCDDSFEMMDLLLNVIRDDGKDIYEAGVCRCFSHLFALYYRAKISTDTEIINKIWIRIKKYRLNVIIQKDLRFKTRIAALISFLGKIPSYFLSKGIMARINKMPYF